MKNDKIELMSSGSVSKAILSLSIPVVCGMMVQVLYNLVDTFFIGKLGEGNQLSAANITAPIMMVQMALSSLVATGAASYISRCLGNEEKSLRIKQFLLEY